MSFKLSHRSASDVRVGDRVVLSTGRHFVSRVESYDGSVWIYLGGDEPALLAGSDSPITVAEWVEPCG